MTTDDMQTEFLRHEALDRASLFASLVDENLLSHPTIESNDKWKQLAQEAVDCLAELYQAIGAVHLK